MKLTRDARETNPGPSEWFTGEVSIETVVTPQPPARAAAAIVSFSPVARTAWHKHPLGQTIYVTAGTGRCQRRGGPIEEIRTGDRVFFEAGEEHWHGAGPDSAMSHIAVQEADEHGNAVAWGEHVTDAEYAG
jgi:quercetin dioxygenase-like cupin family protein